MYALTKQTFDDDGPPSESSTTVDPGVQSEVSKFLEDFKLSTDDEDEDITEDVFNSIISSYMSKRNIIVSTITLLLSYSDYRTLYIFIHSDFLSSVLNTINCTFNTLCWFGKKTVIIRY